MKQKLVEILTVIGLAGLGGLTGTLANKSRCEPYSWKIALSEIIIAVFSGLLIHYILLDLEVSGNLRTAAVALAGYSARGVLSTFNSLFLKILKKINH